MSEIPRFWRLKDTYYHINRKVGADGRFLLPCQPDPAELRQKIVFNSSENSLSQGATIILQTQEPVRQDQG